MFQKFFEYNDYLISLPMTIYTGYVNKKMYSHTLFINIEDLIMRNMDKGAPYYLTN